jgi:hypothetical protein
MNSPHPSFAPSSLGSAPRCLVVSFNRLMPADQGNARRIMQMVRLYKSQGFEVDLLYHNEEGFDPALSACAGGRVWPRQRGPLAGAQAHPAGPCLPHRRLVRPRPGSRGP